MAVVDEMFLEGLAIKRQQFRRGHPDASEQEIERMVRDWLSDRPPRFAGQSSVVSEPRFTHDIDLAVAPARETDRADLRMLAAVADDTEWSRAEEAVAMITGRGYFRGRDLFEDLRLLRLTSDED